MRLAFFDLETSHLDPQVGEILEVAVVVTDEQLNEQARYSAKCIPEHIETASKRALEVNGYTREKWRDAIPLRAALERIAPLMAGAIPAGYNIARFDIPWLEYHFRQVLGYVPKWDYRAYDVINQAIPLMFDGTVEQVKLTTVAEFYGIEYAAHEALADVLATIEVAKRISAEQAIGRRMLKSVGAVENLYRVLGTIIDIIHNYLGNSFRRAA